MAVKVWVVVPDYGLEGYGKPCAACSSEERAKAAIAELQAEGYSSFEIVEFEIDTEMKYPCF